MTTYYEWIDQLAAQTDPRAIPSALAAIAEELHALNRGGDQPEMVVATYSPCCQWVRLGVRDPGVMHNGACRERNGGELGPTVHLTPIRDQS